METHKFQKYPTTGKLCIICKKPNHFAVICRKKDRQVHEIDETDYESDLEDLYVGALDFSKSRDQSDLNDSFVENLYVVINR